MKLKFGAVKAAFAQQFKNTEDWVWHQRTDGVIIGKTLRGAAFKFSIESVSPAEYHVVTFDTTIPTLYTPKAMLEILGQLNLCPDILQWLMSVVQSDSFYEPQR